MKALSVATGYQLPLSIAHEPVEMLADGNIDSDYEIPLDAFVRVRVLYYSTCEGKQIMNVCFNLLRYDCHISQLTCRKC